MDIRKIEIFELLVLILAINRDFLKVVLEHYFVVIYYIILLKQVDWRRSFITSCANEFFDSFIQWHFGVLHQENKIKLGKR